jgi:type IV pilus biogenesis protein PilP
MRNSLWWMAGTAFMACVSLHGVSRGAETTAEQLTEIEAETALLKAHERRAEVQAQIAGKEAEIAARHAERRRSEVAEPEAAPVLRGVEGIGKRLYATLELPHRGTIDVTTGDTLADGSRVTAVHAREVELQTPGKQLVHLMVQTMTGSMAADASAPPPAPNVPLPTMLRMPPPMPAPTGAH